MAIAVGSVSNTPTLASRTTSTITAPTGIANGNLLVACIHVGNTTTTPVTVTPPAGFTAVTNSPSVHAKTADNYVIAMHVYTKVAASEAGNYSFTHATADTEGYMYRLTGTHTSTPIDATPAAQTVVAGNIGNSTTFPSVTTATNGAFLIFAESDWDGPGVGTVSGATPSIALRRAGTQSWIGDGTQTTAGATSSRTRTNGNGVATGLANYAPWVSIVVPIRQSTGAAATSLPPFGMQRKFFTRRINR